MGATTIHAGLGAGGLGSPATTPVHRLQEFIDACVTLSRACYQHATRRAGVRRQLHRFARDHQIDAARSAVHAHGAPTMTFLRQLVRLWRAGATPAELFRLAEMPLRAIERLVGAAPRALDEIDPEEQRLDGLEDEVQLRRRIRGQQPGGLTPAMLREEAELCDHAIALYRERALALRTEADRLDRSGGRHGGMVA